MVFISIEATTSANTIEIGRVVFFPWILETTIALLNIQWNTEIALIYYIACHVIRSVYKADLDDLSPLSGLSYNRKVVYHPMCIYIYLAMVLSFQTSTGEPAIYLMCSIEETLSNHLLSFFFKSVYDIYINVQQHIKNNKKKQKNYNRLISFHSKTGRFWSMHYNAFGSGSCDTRDELPQHVIVSKCVQLIC